MNVAVPVFMGLVFVFIIVIFIARIKRLNKDIDFLKQENKTLAETIEKQKKEIEIKEKNRRDADEKISNLHNGDAVDNAVNILCK